MSERKRLAGLALTVGGGSFLAAVATLHFLYRVDQATGTDALLATLSMLGIALAGSLLFLRFAEPVADRLEIQEDRLSALLWSVGDGILILDERGDVQWANPASQEMHGIEPVQFVRMSVAHLFQGADDALGDFLASGEPRAVAMVSAIHAGGQQTPVEVSFGRSFHLARPLITAIVRDISERPDPASVIQQLDESLVPAARASAHGAGALATPGTTASR